MSNTGDEKFVMPIMGFKKKAKLLDSFQQGQIIMGVCTLKHRHDSERYELALVSAELYED